MTIKIPKPWNAAFWFDRKDVRALLQAHEEQVRAEVLEEAAAAIAAFRDSHCAHTQQAEDPADRCTPDDNSCDFVAAWNDAIGIVRGLKDRQARGGNIV